ncbi:hypothetical protein SUGI_0909570 [Cryptomeria japonica]|nr:hypothetical protein SUGI_0909570 [Cryptomeria japonica]
MECYDCGDTHKMGLWKWLWRLSDKCNWQVGNQTLQHLRTSSQPVPNWELWNKDMHKMGLLKRPWRLFSKCNSQAFTITRKPIHPWKEKQMKEVA